MDRQASSSSSSSTGNRRLQNQYLILYNAISTTLWLIILARVALLLPLVGGRHVYDGVGDFAKWTQTLALLEVAHSASGQAPRPSSLFPLPSLPHPPSAYTGKSCCCCCCCWLWEQS